MILSEKNRRRAKEKWMVTGRTGRKAVDGKGTVWSG